MRLAFLVLALTVPAASPALPSEPPQSAPNRSARGDVPALLCRDDLKARPVRSPEAARAKRLAELPPGDLTLTVVNRVGDCIEPLTVRQGYGGLGRR